MTAGPARRIRGCDSGHHQLKAVAAAITASATKIA
jgi:hypothetical protein